jgi:hypothetical protein
VARIGTPLYFDKRGGPLDDGDDMSEIKGTFNMSSEDHNRFVSWAQNLRTHIMLKRFATASPLDFYNDLTDSEMQAICDRVNNRAA